MGDTPFVSFVGAGPGEAELVTLKAVRRLREAAVIVHDAQIPREVLEHARGDAEVIDAGHGPPGPASRRSTGCSSTAPAAAAASFG